MAVNINGFGGGVLGKTNAAADTVWYGVIPGRANAYARLLSWQYTAGNTANLFTMLRPIGRTTVAAAAITNVAVITVAADPSPSGNTIAAGDQVVLGPCTDGTYRRAQVNTSGWNSSALTLTFTANLAANVNTATKVFNFGIPSDTDPISGAAFPTFLPTANTTATVDLGGVGFVGAQKGDPLLIYSPNATNATNLNNAAYAHTIE